MKALTINQMERVNGGAWWRDALNFGAGACGATSVYRAAAAYYSWAVPGGTAVWLGVALTCAAVTAGASYAAIDNNQSNL